MTAAAVAPDGLWAVSVRTRRLDETLGLARTNRNRRRETGRRGPRLLFSRPMPLRFITVDAEGWLVLLAVPTLEVPT